MFKWHWIKNHDFPKTEQNVICLCKSYKKFYVEEFFYSKNLKSLNVANIDLSKNNSGFVYYSDEYGWILFDDEIVGWIKYPKLKGKV